ncbi:NAD(P)-binding protein [Athelia psychrophila]|uniref:NAD(P)-binding protein n=1 Tax=Athelia psychrophila TaxID=1759441 RepID=A0A166NGR6_9AGAM|nr:NAD(P)-binding protein [Fibularhizoctonia sp. CBS 109695]
MSITKVLITGATGYVGGIVTSRLLAHPRAASFEITALVRSEEKAVKLRSLGIKTAIGSYNDVDKLEDLASEADVLLSIADCDAFVAMQAKLRGLKRRYQATGQRPILIHTVREILDRAAGKFTYEQPFSDMDTPRFEALPKEAMHRNVDTEVVKADTEGYVQTYIIMPSTVWGIPTGALADIGVQNMHSMQIPWLINASLKRGQAGLFGQGENLWPQVEVNETADLFIVLLDQILSNPLTAHGRDGYYLVENGEYSHYEASKTVSTAMYELGLSKDDQPTPFSSEELQANPKLYGFGTHCRCAADRSRSIGWIPVKTSADFLASIKPEVEAMAKAAAATSKPT